MKKIKKNIISTLAVAGIILGGFGCFPSNSTDQPGQGQTNNGGGNTPQEFTFTIAPAEGTTQIALHTKLRITFDQAMDVTTLTTHSSTVCSGSVQLSRDNFVTCVSMQSVAPQMSQGNTVAEFAPIEGMAGAFNHKVRLTTEIRSISGSSLRETYTQTNGFTPDNIAQCIASCDADLEACGGGAGPETELGAYCLELRNQCTTACN